MRLTLFERPLEINARQERWGAQVASWPRRWAFPRRDLWCPATVWAIARAYAKSALTVGYPAVRGSTPECWCCRRPAPRAYNCPRRRA